MERKTSLSRWRNSSQSQQPNPRLEGELCRPLKPMVIAQVRLIAVRYLLLVVGGLVEKCLSSRIWCDFRVTDCLVA